MIDTEKVLGKKRTNISREMERFIKEMLRIRISYFSFDLLYLSISIEKLYI